MTLRHLCWCRAVKLHFHTAAFLQLGLQWDREKESAKVMKQCIFIIRAISKYIHWSGYHEFQGLSLLIRWDFPRPWVGPLRTGPIRSCWSLYQDGQWLPELSGENWISNTMGLPLILCYHEQMTLALKEEEIDKRFHPAQEGNPLRVYASNSSQHMRVWHGNGSPEEWARHLGIPRFTAKKRDGRGPLRRELSWATQDTLATHATRKCSQSASSLLPFLLLGHPSISSEKLGFYARK